MPRIITIPTTTPTAIPTVEEPDFLPESAELLESAESALEVLEAAELELAVSSLEGSK